MTAEALGHALSARGDVEVHHGSLSKEIRIDAEERFKKGEIRTLICTSSMELGIDIGRVDHVIQFGSPREVARLVQRVGRAGHQLNTISRGTILATGFDDLLESLVIARWQRQTRSSRWSLTTIAARHARQPDRGDCRGVRRDRTVPDPGYRGADRHLCRCGTLLDDVCTQLEEHRLIRIDGSRIVTTARARRYLSGNLSMIHDERKIPIFDMVSRRTVGTLDESFVVGWVHTGAVFITKGQLWRVLEMNDGRLTVEPAKKRSANSRHGRGSRSRSRSRSPARSGRFGANAPRGTIHKEKESIAFAAHYPFRDGEEPVAGSRPTGSSPSRTSMMAWSAMSAPATRQTRRSGRVLSILISARDGTTVGIELDAYRILLRLPSAIRAADVRDFLLSLEPAHMPGILKLALKRTALFKWKLVQIAKKFGAIDPDADYEKISIQRLLDYFDNTVVQQEAYRELLSGYMDVDAAAQWSA